MDELTSRLEALAMHNSEPQRRQRMMASVATMQEEHIKRMAFNPVSSGWDHCSPVYLAGNHLNSMDAANAVISTFRTFRRGNIVSSNCKGVHSNAFMNVCPAATLSHVWADSSVQAFTPKRASCEPYGSVHLLTLSSHAGGQGCRS